MIAAKHNLRIGEKVKDNFDSVSHLAMAYSEAFAERIKRILSTKTKFIEKKMFGGVAYMVNDKMCVGISPDKDSGDDRLMARVGPEFHGEALKQKGCREMTFTGKPMKGFVFIHPEGYATDAQLQFWIERTLEYNRAIPAKPAKKRK